MFSHEEHFLYPFNLPVDDLLCSCIDQTQKISLCQWIVFAGFIQNNWDWFFVGLLILVDFFNGSSPEIHFSKCWIIVKHTKRLFSDILHDFHQLQVEQVYRLVVNSQLLGIITFQHVWWPGSVPECLRDVFFCVLQLVRRNGAESACLAQQQWDWWEWFKFCYCVHYWLRSNF